ncbi:4-oxalomesaconate tautomerase [Microbacterium sp. cx-55]|uniref:4-oxalomesaconate tautomerase n=1 Tax=unclassified Microbacterium TaxID=2609290 RepID=UPI001CBC9F84|nr:MULTISPECIES: 4-oxalomesaconate tautomerase [unclassified Microbacterium]MBZ4488393.1 4-oxalomesaconate tautomerase [Microbacterium sp. cx-55]MCC4909544.1 4-oxalomesaconate tautomerase [Microbacterium sp. cx-59]UGB35045.1 4-oxalomesaconate tautomerase [Microbacterium sp. cx-55]
MTTDDRAAGVRCMLMRGGTSKGAFFLEEDLPSDPAARDDLLLRIMGSPDPAQIDGIGGAHPLTSKVAVVRRSDEPGIDIDYLFLQVAVDEPLVADAQTCGNLLAAIGPFALERGLVRATGDETVVRIRLRNTGDIADATFATPGGRPDYDGDVAIDGVPGTAAGISLQVSGGDKPLFPSGAITDKIDGHRVTLIDNGMPVVLLAAGEFGVAGDESPGDLEARVDLLDALERVRLVAGERMGLGDVRAQTIPKMILLSPPSATGAISARAFIPIRVHTSIGVLMAASVAAGVRIPGTIAADLARAADGDTTRIEHPTGTFSARVSVHQDADGRWHAASVSVRTARPLFDGTVFPRPRR